LEQFLADLNVSVGVDASTREDPFRSQVFL
jgi:hypothetical protein